MPILVMPAAPDLFQHLRPGDEVVLKTGDLNAVGSSFGELAGRQVSVKMAVVEVDTLAGVLETQLELVRTAPCPLMLEAAEAGAFAPLIRNAAIMAGQNIRVVLPLRHRRDLQALKILTSLKVHVQTDLTRSDVDWAMAEEGMVDSLLALGPRAPLDPFMMLSSIYADPGSHFTLGNVYFDDGRDYVQVDESGRLYSTRRDLLNNTALDVELAEMGESRECLGCAEARQHREHMMRLTACAFCPGYRLCKGYLSPRPESGACQHLFENLLETSQARTRALTATGAVRCSR